MFDHTPKFAINWSHHPDRSLGFTDSVGRQCMLGDSSAAEAPAIRFGVERSVGQTPGQRARMHLRKEDLSKILEELRTFAARGEIQGELRFTDWDRRECILRPTPGVANSLDLGVLGAPSGNHGDDTIYSVLDSVMTLSQGHLAVLIGTLNTFIAHGTVGPR